MTSLLCLHFIHVLFFETFAANNQVIVVDFLLCTETAWIENLYLCVEWYFLSLFFSLRKNAKQHQDKHQVCVKFNASLQPMSSFFYFFFIYSIIHHLLHFRESPQDTTSTTFVIFLHEAILFMELPNFYEVISLLSICFTDILGFL